MFQPNSFYCEAGKQGIKNNSKENFLDTAQNSPNKYNGNIKQPEKKIDSLTYRTNDDATLSIQIVGNIYRSYTA